jgi:alkylation response protein AidB-like acyl-CoA dehydrogenase
MPTKLPNGRPPDPETQAEAQALAERFVSKRAKKYLEVLDSIAMNDETPPDQRRMAIGALFERGLGKASVPDKDDQLGKLAEVLKQVAKISGSKSNTRIIEISSREPDSGSEAGSDSVRGLPPPQQEGAVDYSEAEGDS